VPVVRESIVTTLNDDGTAYIAPLGVIEAGEHLVIAPFRPSTTLENLWRRGTACINYTDDALIFAGCVTRRRRDWPVVRADRLQGWRLEAALAHAEVEVVEVVEDEQRPRFVTAVRHEAMHRPFRGMNRARAAVLEGAILVTRLHLLPEEKVTREMEYLQIAVDRTAGPAEREAWGWLTEAVQRHRGAAA
jgi:hypothetical protein